MGQEAYKRLNVSERGRISRSPLDISELATLINTAIELHARAVAHEAAGRWWIAPLISVVSAFTGALVGGLVAS
jgi:hypothetical protein